MNGEMEHLIGNQVTTPSFLTSFPSCKWWKERKKERKCNNPLRFVFVQCSQSLRIIVTKPIQSLKHSNRKSKKVAKSLAQPKVREGARIIHSVPVNRTVRLTGTSLLNLLTGHTLTGLLNNQTLCCPDIKFCVLSSRQPDSC